MVVPQKEGSGSQDMFCRLSLMVDDCVIKERGGSSISLDFHLFVHATTI